MKTLDLVEITCFGIGIEGCEARIILVENTPGFLDVVIGNAHVGGRLGAEHTKEATHASTLLMGLGDRAVKLDFHDFQTFLWWVGWLANLLELKPIAP